MADHISISHCDVQVVAKPISSYQHIRKVRLVEPKKALAAGPLGVAIALYLTSLLRKTSAGLNEGKMWIKNCG